MSPARLTAFHVLQRVEQGAYASDLLVRQAAELDSRDAGLASELVFGSLRRQNQLDYLIGSLSGRPASGLDVEVRIALRIGLYQIYHLDRVPRHAAVSESVDLVKKARKASAAGYVNAVLRKAHAGEVAWPDRARTLACPNWLLRRWDKQFGPLITEVIARAFLEPPETYIRLGPGEGAPPQVTLEATGIPGCYRVTAGDPRELRIQDIGSQSIVPLLDLAPGQSLLDLCASPGNKTAQALESGVRAIACDLHSHRMDPLRRLGCQLVQLDGTQPLPFDVSTRFDRILLDAPCSGTGTLGRNPEIKWRLQPADLADLAGRQTKLLTHALSHLAPGGRLVYSTCSLEAEENEQVVETILSVMEGYRLLEARRRTPGVDPGDGFFASVITSE